jgi:hypothetical protein
MQIAEIESTFQSVWRPGYGSVAIDELAFMQDLIVQHRPRRLLEIGMASGLSTGFLARFMSENGGETLVSIDHDDTFFGDPTKLNGFLVPELYADGTTQVDLVKFCTSLELDRVPGTFDLAFVDANHQHPWPAIDTLALYPRMTGPKIVIHHDLRLFSKQDVMFGIGPKYLFDQFPDSHRIRSTANGGNIFAVDLSMDQVAFEALMCDLLKLPWSLRGQLPPVTVEKIRTLLRTSYSDQLLVHFNRIVATQNLNDRFRSGL